MKPRISRREFLKLGGLGLGAMALRPLSRPWLDLAYQEDFPDAERLGRAVDPEVTVRAAPTTESAEVGTLTEDTIVPWLREHVGYTPYRNQRWVETPQGFVWAPLLQPVRNKPNAPLTSLPSTNGGLAQWVEVTVPYVNVVLANAEPLSPRVRFLVENNRNIRLYYGQVMLADEIRTGDGGTVEYHIREPRGSYGDHYWAPAEAFRPITADEIAPISPEVENKYVLVDLNRQTLSCYENDREVYFCRVSTGRVDRETPVSPYFSIHWKLMSVHMSGGTAGAGYDLAGVAWTSVFATDGVAIHGTFWHNNFGERTSAGCVNAAPEDAKFVFRWTGPHVPYDPGYVDIGEVGNAFGTGTNIRVIEY
jgi:lipoprotein-anchoring transpeptidase ErfK/SrfK